MRSVALLLGGRSLGKAFVSLVASRLGVGILGNLGAKMHLFLKGGIFLDILVASMLGYADLFDLKLLKSVVNGKELVLEKLFLLCHKSLAALSFLVSLFFLLALCSFFLLVGFLSLELCLYSCKEAYRLIEKISESRAKSVLFSRKEVNYIKSEYREGEDNETDVVYEVDDRESNRASDKSAADTLLALCVEVRGGEE